MRVVLALALAGLRHRPARWLLLAMGVAVTAVLPVVAGGLKLSAESAAVRDAIDRIPAAERAVLATSGGNLTAGELAGLDSAMRPGLVEVGVPRVRRLLVFRPLSLAGSSFTLAAADQLGSAVRVTSGRLPASCTPTRCEVVLTSASTPEDGAATKVSSFNLAATQLGLVVTGTAELLDPRPIGAGLIDGAQPLLLGAAPDQLALLASLELFGRTSAWIGDLDGTTVARRGAGTFGAQIATLTDRLNTTGRAGVVIGWPGDAITAAAARAISSAARFTVLGAAAAALQLGFCVVAAVGMRRRQQLVVTLLTRRGAGRAQVAAVPLAQLVVVVAAGLALGGSMGTIAVAAGSGAVPAGRWPVALAALQSALPTLGWLAAAAVVIAAAVALWPARAAVATRVALDCLLLATIGLTVLAVTGGSTGGADPLATSVTTLLAVGAGLVTARLWPSVVGAVTRLAGGSRGSGGQAGTRRRSAAWQVGVVGGRHRPLVSAVTAAFVAAATCSTLFAGSYRSTLDQSAEDQASYLVPLDARVAPSRDVAAPLTVLDTTALTGLGGGVGVHPVISSSVTVFSGTERAAGLPLVGLDAAALTGMHRFAATTGTTGAAADPSVVAAGLRPAGVSGGGPATPIVPAGTRVVAVQASGLTGDEAVLLWVAQENGAERRVTMDEAGGILRAVVDTPVSLRIVGVEIAESASHLVHRQHAIGEGNTDHALLTGTLVLGSAKGDGRDLEWTWQGWGSDEATVQPGGAAGTMSVAYRVSDNRVVLSPEFVARNRLPALPVATDPVTAARAVDGIVPISIGALTVRGRVTAVLTRLPTIGGRFVLADRTAVAALLDRAEPGTAAVTQVWISAPADLLPRVRQVLAVPPASTALVLIRQDVQHAIAADPVAARAGTLLTLAGLLALLMALVAIALAVRIEQQDGAADHLSLELDGVRPAGIRRVLLVRAGLILLVGVPVGSLAGLLLTDVAVRLISVGAAGIAVQPPLQTAVGAGFTVLIVVGVLVGGLVVAIGTSALAARERRPMMPEMDLR